MLLSLGILAVPNHFFEFLRKHLLAGLLPVEAGMWNCGEAGYVLCTMLMAHPDQAPSLQGLQGVNPEVLAVEDLGTGSGWQQSRQN